MRRCEAQLDGLRERLGQEKLVVAFVAEFSRGKSELINAIFFADAGRRILPATPGRTTMCPVELAWDADEAAGAVAAADRDAAERPVARRTAHAAARLERRSSSTSSDPEQLAESLREVMRTSWVSKDAGACARLLERRDARRQPAAGRTRPRRGAGLAPCADQLPAPAAQAGPGGARHAGPERDRRRARADAEPAAHRARDGVHPRRRHRRHQVRPGDLARPPRRRRAVALRRAEQDRRDDRPAGHAPSRCASRSSTSARRRRARWPCRPSASSRCRRARRWRRASTATPAGAGATAACRRSRPRSARS